MEDFDFFSVDKEYTHPEKGKVLISEPFLEDSYFKRSIVLLAEYSKEGALGFVLNKPLDIKMQELVSDFPDFNAKISLGGPVNTNSVHFIHTLGEIIPQSVPIIDDIYWGGDFEIIKEFVANGVIAEDQIRFFVGYSGWSANQLDGELERDSWLVTDVDSKQIMKNNDRSFWQEMLNRIDKSKYRMWTKFPENPQFN